MTILDRKYITSTQSGAWPPFFQQPLYINVFKTGLFTQIQGSATADAPIISPSRWMLYSSGAKKLIKLPNLVERLNGLVRGPRILWNTGGLFKFHPLYMALSNRGDFTNPRQTHVFIRPFIGFISPFITNGSGGSPWCFPQPNCRGKNPKISRINERLPWLCARGAPGRCSFFVF